MARGVVLAAALLGTLGVSPVAAQSPAPAPAPAPAASASASASATASPGEDPATRPAPQRISGAITLDPPLETRLIAPPFLREKRGDVRTTALFPFYFDRRSATVHERLLVPYYYKRSAQLDVDVPLGLLWWLRGPEQNTFVLPPFYTHRKKGDWALGLFPVFGTGLFGKHHHTVVPPLLLWIDGDDKNRHTFAGPYFRWQSEHALWWGLFPFLWHKRDEVDRFTLVPPVYFRFADDDPLHYTTVIPPFFHRRKEDATSYGLVPLFFRKESPKLKSLTVPLAVFHHASGPEEFRLVTPLLSYLTKKNERTWITPLYQRRRGDRNFDAVAPLFFHTWDNRDASWGLMFPPVYWHWEDPANDTTVVLPFFGRWFHEGVSSSWVIPLLGRYKSFERDEQTWWVAPTFQYGWTETSWTFNIHPLLYIHRAPEKEHYALAPLYFDFQNHEERTRRQVAGLLYWNFKNEVKQTRSLVLAPLVWDFENKRKQRRRLIGFPLYWDFRNDRLQKRGTAAFPLYWRFVRGQRVRTVALNVFHEKKQDAAGKHWLVHVFPLVSVGGGDNESSWSFLYGLAGYERRGTHRRVKAFWIPFSLGD